MQIDHCQIGPYIRMRPRYFASSDILIGVPLITKGTIFAVVCFREKITTSVLWPNVSGPGSGNFHISQIGILGS